MDTAFQKAFQEAGNFEFVDSDALQHCKRVAEQYKLQAKEVALHYDEFASVRDSSLDVSANHVAAFESFLSKQLAEKAKLKQAAAVKPRIVARTWEEPNEFPTPKRQATGAAPSGFTTPTPAAGTRSPLQATPGGTQFANRQNRGQVVSSYNEQLVMPARAQASKDQRLPGLQMLGEQLVAPGIRHLHMTDTLEGKVHAINDRILDFGDAIRRAIPEAEDINRTSVAEVSQEPVWVVGRVVPDSETGVLNDQSVLLEGSREASSGARVKLDLTQVASFRLFPGQVLAARGLNPTGAVFVAQQLVTHCPPSSAPPPAAAGAAAPAAGLSMVVAAGPFTTADNLHYEPLRELLAYCSSASVDQVMLIGPFVDVEHPLVKDGCLAVTYEQVFKEEVVKRLASWQQEERNQGSRVLLMPSVRDVHLLPVFPQPPIALDSSSSGGGSGGGDRLMSVQNPATFVSEGLVVAASGQDLLMHLSACEVSRGQHGQDSLTARASHVIGQRSFYPLFPAPLGSCLDTSHYANLQLARTPNLLLLPSNLTPFAKLLQPAARQPEVVNLPSQAATVVVNPGRLAKGVSGGTFAHVYVVPPATSGDQEAHQRIRVDIQRV